MTLSREPLPASKLLGKMRAEIVGLLGEPVDSDAEEEAHTVEGTRLAFHYYKERVISIRVRPPGFVGKRDTGALVQWLGIPADHIVNGQLVEVTDLDDEMLVVEKAPKGVADECRKTAQKLIAKGRSCGVNMGRYKAVDICSRLQEELDGDGPLRRLKVQLAEDCGGVRAMVEGDRI